MERKGLWDTSWGCLIAFLLFVGCLALLVFLMVWLDRSHPNVIGAIAGCSILAGLLLPALFDHLENHRYKGKLAARESAADEREAAQDAREYALNQRETEVSYKETHITQLLREREAQHIRNIADRDYLSASPVFQSIHSDPDLNRLTSSMTQDLKIRALQITATIHSKSGNEYKTTLESCTCTDFERRKSPCKHMYRLAAEIGALLSAEDEALNAAIVKKLSALQQIEGASKKEQARAHRQASKTKQQ